MNQYALPCINISHFVSGFCPECRQANATVSRDPQLLHITFVIFLCLRLCIADVVDETFQQQATVIICIESQIVMYIAMVPYNQ